MFLYQQALLEQWSWKGRIWFKGPAAGLGHCWRALLGHWAQSHLSEGPYFIQAHRQVFADGDAVLACLCMTTLAIGVLEELEPVQNSSNLQLEKHTLNYMWFR